MSKEYRPVKNPKKTTQIEVPVGEGRGEDVQRPEQRQVYFINLSLTRQFLVAAQERANLTDRELYLELQGDMILSQAGYDINGQPKRRSTQ